MQFYEYFLLFFKCHNKKNDELLIIKGTNFFEKSDLIRLKLKSPLLP